MRIGEKGCVYVPSIGMIRMEDQERLHCNLSLVITQPFRTVAFDLVGPLPRTKGDYKYLLTYMCLGSKYPDAVPLRRVDAETVAEAIMEIFSRTGTPEEKLTDQGTVFVGRLMTQLCQKWGIRRLKTSAYHPQTDGRLERWLLPDTCDRTRPTKDSVLYAMGEISIHQDALWLEERAQATFQRMMNDVLEDLRMMNDVLEDLENLENFSGAYIYDILIYIDSWENHLRHTPDKY